MCMLQIIAWPFDLVPLTVGVKPTLEGVPSCVREGVELRRPEPALRWS